MARLSREYLVLLGAHFLFFLNFSELILLPKYFQALGLKPSAIGLLMGAFSVSVLAGLPVAGLVSERVPRKALFTIGAALMAVTSSLYGVCAGMMPALYLLRIVQGLGFSSAFGIIGAMAAESGGAEDRTLMLGMLTAVGITTHAVGPVLGEHLIAAYGYHALFASAAAFGAGALALAFLLPPRPPASSRGKGRLNPGLRLNMASAVLGVVFGSAVIFLPPFLQTLGVHDSSPFFLAFTAGSLLVVGMLYRQVRIVPERLIWPVAAVFLALLPAGAGWADRTGVLVALSLIFGAGYGYLYPTLNTAVINANPELKGVANALFVWSFNLGMLVASVGFGYLCEAVGYVGAFRSVAVLGLVLLVTIGRTGARGTGV
ncbi:MAG TPA: MFS transporter [Deltaproteobacteria bacterium]|nr:MFS transporter [Deltaproteobacteria bacterium]